MTTFDTDNGSDTCLVCGTVGLHSHPQPGHPTQEGAGFDCSCGLCLVEIMKEGQA